MGSMSVCVLSSVRSVVHRQCFEHSGSNTSQILESLLRTSIRSQLAMNVGCFQTSSKPGWCQHNIQQDEVLQCTSAAFLLGPSSLNSTEHCSGKPCARRSFFWCPCVPYICTPHILPHMNSFGFSSPAAPLIPAERRYARAFGLPYAAQDEGSGGRLDINHHMMSLQWLEMMYYIISRPGCFG